MLVHAPEKETRLSPELATAATRWRPQSSAGAAWRGEGAPARGEVGPGVRGGSVWSGGRSRRWPAASAAAGGAELFRRIEEAGREAGG